MLFANRGTFRNHSFNNIAGYVDDHPDFNNLRKVDYENKYTNPNWACGESLWKAALPHSNRSGASRRLYF
ncbi:phospholipase C [Penicillium daleae]|uniref:Phospholipase C n=1 Tax=Penicillium daleae TaxID=63821 RepID=A0AAD6G788_9EURO|nr:phospholipase C [Penicillium daleae]KAJ5461350.1 phospholipase C [Penicillium daleae]